MEVVVGRGGGYVGIRCSIGQIDRHTRWKKKEERHGTVVFIKW